MATRMCFITAIRTARRITSFIKPARERSTWSAQSHLGHGSGSTINLCAGLSSILQIDGRGIEGFLRRTLKRAIVEEAWLIFLVAVSVKCHRPALLITKVTQTTEVSRGLPQPLEIFLTRFPKHGWIETRWHSRLGVRVDIAQLAAEVHIQARVLTRIVLAGVCEDTILGPFAHCHRYFYPARMG